MSKPADDLGAPDLIILPGSKSTCGRPQLSSQHRPRTRNYRCCFKRHTIVGICGGYQILGTAIHDPKRIESSNKLTAGMGLLPLTTRFGAVKFDPSSESQCIGRVRSLRQSEGCDYFRL
jgi:adenosylcobyric acid synthase